MPTDMGSSNTSPTANRQAAVPRTYTVEAHSVPGGAAEIATKATTVAFDASSDQSDALPGPADLLTAAFAACVLKNVERFSHILPFRYRRATITVEADRQDTPPRMIALRYRLRVATDEPPRRVELLHMNIRRHGTIYNTLATVCAVTGEIIAEAPAPGEMA